MCESYEEVKLCPTGDCPLYRFRLSKGRVSVKDIKKRCLDCGEGTPQAVRKCEFPDCSLYPYRLGKNPNMKNRGDASRFRGKNLALFGKNHPAKTHILPNVS